MTQHRSGCIGFHIKALLQLGATRVQLEDTLAVSVYMGGGPALRFAAEAIAAWEQLGSLDQPSPGADARQ